MMFLEQLSNASGVSGNEEAVRELILDRIKPHIDEYKIDALGNLIAIKHARRSRTRRALRVMLDAHMDEVGLLIVQADKDGYLRFKKVGSIDDRVLLSKVVQIGKDRVPGVIGYKPVHLLKADERARIPEVDTLTIDIGCKTDGEALGAVKTGDFATFATTFEEFGEGLVKGKALDDRAGCAALVELLDDKYPFDVYAAFTVQEEIGLRGARAAAYFIEPDIAFAIETTVCDDSPKERDESPTTRLGHGPAISVMDRSHIADKRLLNLLFDTARAEGIPYQIKQPLIGSTDAGRIHLSRGGVPSVSIATPARYIHSPAAVMSLSDYENKVDLLRHALPKLSHGLDDL